MTLVIDDDVNVSVLAYSLARVGLLAVTDGNGGLRIKRGPLADAGEAQVRALLDDFIEEARRNGTDN